ncbi:MAG TPA: tRNA (adenosine(37)-N6)-threonylcarbamoyltransferase complex ATPase subunit type 1 TsaE [Leucothrix sp.]|nr:tRNA (adenosine(37)-N6)-threonylcarbamoyltransferase complex ATPase subunit type 1 TsaE [Leucothrix sp.]
MKKTIHIPNEKAMMDFGGKIAEQLPKGGLVFLNGDLGAGKTTLVRGLLRSLGYQGIVKSPTYTLVEPYEINGRNIYHFDLYRLGDPEELEYMGGRDYWNSDALCLIEWPEKAQGYLPEADIILNIKYLNEGRDLEIAT